MRFVVRLLQQLYRRVFHRDTPSPKMQPKNIQAGKKPVPSDKQTPAKPQQGQDSRFFRDRLEAEGTDAKRNFYAKHRHRLENQDQHRGGQQR